MAVAADESLVIRNYSSQGRYLDIGGLKTFINQQGDGEVVLCLHGVPTSSFLYRKVIRKLSELGMTGISFDFPGLGLTERPENFDYSFSGLSEFACKVVEALRLEKFHLVVHDIGGPIGFALAAQMKEKIKSITILNTWIAVKKFTKPLPMRPFEIPVLDNIELKLINHSTWYFAFETLGVLSMDGIETEEVHAYVDLLKREDGGRAFLKIMKSFDKSESFQKRCYAGVMNATYPLQAIWGMQDPGLTFERYGKEIISEVPLRDFLGSKPGICYRRIRLLLLLKRSS